MTRTRIGGAVAAAALLLAACGSGGEADKTADQILADAANALQNAKSFHIDASSTGSSAIHLTVDVVAGGKAHGTVTSEGVSAQFVSYGGKFYIQGRDFFAKFAGPQAASLIGDRWVLLPNNANAGGFESFIDISKLSTCLRTDHGTLSKGGTTTVSGQSAVVVVDKGDKPGTAPGKLSVATSGTAYPLLFQVTGATRPGSPPGGSQCSSTSSSSPGGTSNDNGVLTFSHFDAAGTVTPPPSPLDLSSLGG